MDIDPIIAMIDSVIETDWSVSDDAMRCTPEESRPQIVNREGAYYPRQQISWGEHAHSVRAFDVPVPSTHAMEYEQARNLYVLWDSLEVMRETMREAAREHRAARSFREMMLDWQSAPVRAPNFHPETITWNVPPTGLGSLRIEGVNIQACIVDELSTFRAWSDMPAPVEIPVSYQLETLLRRIIEAIE